MTGCHLMFTVIIGLCFYAVSIGSAFSTEERIANDVALRYQVITNILKDGELTAKLILTNKGKRDIVDDSWTIYFSHMHRILGTRGDSAKEIKMEHVNGWISVLKPIKGAFKGFKSNVPYEITFGSANWEISKTDIFSNWYVVGADQQIARVIKSTQGESLNFVGSFASPSQYKRVKQDKFAPWSPESRYDRLQSGNKGPNDKDSVDGLATTAAKSQSITEKFRIIPQPKTMNCESKISNVMINKKWILYKPLNTNQLLINNEINFLRNKIGIVHRKEAGLPPTTPYIHIYQKGSMEGQYTYTSFLKSQVPHITITYGSQSGLLYALTTLWALVQQSNRNKLNLPSCNIDDEPRYPYRGFMLDVSRNFRNKAYISKLLQNMALLKLNKLHLHLVDDEGWRLEIPGLPELTEIGSQRCHDLSRRKCLMPHLGSCPNCQNVGPGSGYISAAEYKELLKEARTLNIDIIPEIDMPGHSHAAIIAMEERERRTKSAQYRISDPKDTSTYLSVQLFKDNAINPCMNSTYNFVEKIIKEVRTMHNEAGIPLKIFHFGGDETPNGAWVNSPACENYEVSHPKARSNRFRRNSGMPYDGINRSKLMKHFVEKVASLVSKQNLDLAGWEDGFFGAGEQAYKRSNLPTKEVYAFAWNNIWEWGAGPRAYKLANSGYKTILAPGTHVYLDHPQEPNSDERGLYWATRFTDTERTFGYVATDIYRNIEYSRLGDKLKKDAICPNSRACPKLKKPENIIGLQAELWSEVVRTDEQADAMIFPRLAAVAERAWKVAKWEFEENKAEQVRDYKSFATALVNYLLPYWDESNIGPAYYLPLVGAKIVNKRLMATSAFPGLNIQYKLKNGSWKDYPQDKGLDISNFNHVDVHLRTKSFGPNPRFSKAVKINVAF